MSSDYDTWKTTAPDHYAPERESDLEAVEEIHLQVRTAVYLASEGSSDYEDKPDLWRALLECALEITRPSTPERPNMILESALLNDGEGAALTLELTESLYFGENIGPRRTFHRDGTLAELAQWLRDRKWSRDDA